MTTKPLKHLPKESFIFQGKNCNILDFMYLLLYSIGSYRFYFTRSHILVTFITIVFLIISIGYGLVYGLPKLEEKWETAGNMTIDEQ